MKPGTIKGALLEYLIRNVLKNCGFTNVIADNLYSFERGELFFVNGKGAAHDADVIMNPPIQMPFTYPTQVIFECKAYGLKAKLPIVRNALGLRNDLNDFEIVTKDSIKKRQNNRRATYAIETRSRFIYQVGVAAINEFSAPSIEFAANNKIPLLSLSWFLSSTSIKKLNDINQQTLDVLEPEALKNTYQFFKDRNGNIYNEKYELAKTLLESNNVLGDIVTYANTVINRAFIGLLETGDMVFLFSTGHENVLTEGTGITYKGQIHWNTNRPNVWTLTINENTHFDFYVPQKIFDYWKTFNQTRVAALDIKQRYFSKIFVFNKVNNPEMPFSIITLDTEWLESERENLLP